ncbi:hypothetical protein [Paenibacillus alkalitolerans]|uniref:hypothetical protein n=1 Tax=Paenibacillus alkalitolerans TaxID=2799335 RepID=UPI001F4160D5|nr:hypothetical protein [Paenibacillus alkalitolerans]
MVNASLQRFADYDAASIVLLFIWLSYIAAGKLTENTDVLSQSALRVQQGRRIPDIPVQGSKELRQVIQTMNDLIGDVNRQESMRKDMMQDLAHLLSR